MAIFSIGKKLRVVVASFFRLLNSYSFFLFVWTLLPINCFPVISHRCWTLFLVKIYSMCYLFGMKVGTEPFLGQIRFVEGEVILRNEMLTR